MREHYMLTVSTLKEAGIGHIILISGGVLYVVILSLILIYQLVLYAVKMVKKSKEIDK
jgi:hypothetical protein